MPTYLYECPSCEARFDVYKPVSSIDELEVCPTCGRGHIEGSCRVIEARHFYGEKPDNAFYSQALGKVVKSRKAQLQEAKARGWEEVGNTDIERNISQTEAAREKRIADRWEELKRG